MRVLAAAAVLLWVSVAHAQQPDVFSHDGVLSVTLVAAAGKIHVGDLELDGATYNGIYAGPVLHVHPGDLMRVRLVNHLTQPTNLHFHGIRASPLGNGDNAHLVIQPDHSFDYEVRIPVTQPIGLYWYHPHIHHAAEHQTMDGLSGTIVVDPPDPLPIAQRLFVLKDMVFDDDTGNNEIDGKLYGIVQSVNGQPTISETMRPGEIQLWRFANETSDRALHIVLTGHVFHITTDPDHAVTVLDIPPAGRFDVFVDAGETGHYTMIAKGVMTGTGSERVPDRVIGWLDVAGERLPAQTIPSEPLPSDLRSVRIDARREVVFTQTTTTKTTVQHFFINGKLFDIDRMDIRVPLGNTEEWTIRNDSDDMHAFHIHQIGFQVTEINGKQVPFTGYVDTVNVPERGEVKLRMPFTDPLILGRFMFHCHVLKHEDGGMMAHIEVYDPTPRSLSDQIGDMYRHVSWWWHGVPWTMCGLQDG